ncbi:MAG: SIS domain-containing protein [Solirubrobacterales bacterium]|nr:SIS domain-containing protein [Solirubrobacterales bacterium]
MLNFDEQRFLSIQSGAVGMAAEMHDVIGKVLDRGVTEVCFAGAGGAGILMLPAVELLARRSSIRVSREIPAELMLSDTRHVSEQTLIVLPSLSGTTSETIEILEWAKRRGATVLSLTGHADTPVAEGADFNFTNFAEDDTSSESFYLQSLLLALAVLDQRDELDGYGDLITELEGVPELLLEVKRAFEPEARGVASRIAAEPWHIITGAGAVWPEAWYYGMCILEEMQWIRTRPVHASDFFHGTLELVEQGVSVITMKGEDSARPLVDRVERFVAQHTDKLLSFDTAELAQGQLSHRARGLVSPVLLATVLERVDAHLEVITDHPLTTRRYYRRVEY